MVRSIEVDSRAMEIDTRAFQQTVTPPATFSTIDDFEDEDLAEYNIAGPGSIYSIDTGSPIEGDASVIRDDETGGYEVMIAGSGAADPLPAFPAKGDIFQMKWRSAVAGTNFVQSGIVFGASDVSNYYSARYQWENDGLSLLSRVAGSNTNLAGTTGVSSGDVGANDVIVLEITWDDGTLGGTEDDITVTLYDADKSTEYGSINANNDDHATENGVGIRTFVDEAANLTGDAIEVQD